MTRLSDILRRRERLLADSAARRGRVAYHAAGVVRPLSWLTRWESRVRQAVARPGMTAVAMAAGLGLLFALGPRRALAWGAKGWSAWRVWRKLRGA